MVKTLTWSTRLLTPVDSNIRQILRPAGYRLELRQGTNQTPYWLTCSVSGRPVHQRGATCSQQGATVQSPVFRTLITY